METIVRETGELTRVLEVTAEAADLEIDVKVALRKRQIATHMKGFRPGRVPVHLIRRMYGDEVAASVADEFVKEVFEDLVLQSGEHDVIGQPTVIKLDYDLDSDMEAHIEFEVRPNVELQDLSNKVLELPVKVVSDESVHLRMKELQEKEAELRPLSDEETIGEEEAGAQDYVEIDAVAVDPESRVVLIGESKSEVAIDFSADQYEDDPEYAALRAALKGKRVGDEVFVSFLESPEAEALIETRPGKKAYRATVKEAKRRELPEMDNDWAERVTEGKAKTVAELQEQTKAMLEEYLPRQNELIKYYTVKARVAELHPFALPKGIIDRELARSRYENELGEGEFDEAAARNYYEREFRWYFICEAVAARQEIVVTDDELKKDLQDWGGLSDSGTDVATRTLRGTEEYEERREQARGRRIVDYLVSQFGEVKTFELGGPDDPKAGG